MNTILQDLKLDTGKVVYTIREFQFFPKENPNNNDPVSLYKDDYETGDSTYMGMFPNVEKAKAYLKQYDQSENYQVTKYRERI